MFSRFNTYNKKHTILLIQYLKKLRRTIRSNRKVAAGIHTGATANASAFYTDNRETSKV